MQLISIDWGTSSFRAARWRYDAQTKPYVVERRESDQGLLAIKDRAFELYLIQVLADWLTKDQLNLILMSGMVGSKTGWLEAPYVAAPASLNQIAAELREVPLRSVELKNAKAFIVPGVAQYEPFDVMRGEETQLFGMRQVSGNESLIILPGTHSKQVQLNNGKITQFKTYLTGELFALLSQHSVLASLIKTMQFDDHSFAMGVSQAQTAHDLSAQLFSLRARALLSNDRFCTASALSGLLIGSELRGLARTTRVILVGADTLCSRYASVLRLLNIEHAIEKEKSAELGALRIAQEAKLI